MKKKEEAVNNWKFKKNWIILKKMFCLNFEAYLYFK